MRITGVDFFVLQLQEWGVQPLLKHMKTRMASMAPSVAMETGEDFKDKQTAVHPPQFFYVLRRQIINSWRIPLTDPFHPFIRCCVISSHGRKLRIFKGPMYSLSGVV